MQGDVTVKLERSDGQTFIIDDYIWRITEMSGFDNLVNTLTTTKNINSDGVIVDSKQISSKDRSVKATCMIRNLNDVYRELTRKFFNPKYTFKLYATYLGATKWCEGELTGFKLPTDNVYDNLKLEFTIFCPTPYMYSVDNFNKNIAEVVPAFGFPYISIIDTGFHFSHFQFADEVFIENNGDVETFCKAVFTAKGEVLNPSLKKDTEYVKINDTLQKGDVLVIDFEQKPTKITKNGVNCINKVDRQSNFYEIKLNVGTNSIGFDADNGSNLLDVVIYFNKRYNGL